MTVIYIQCPSSPDPHFQECTDDVYFDPSGVDHGSFPLGDRGGGVFPPLDVMESVSKMSSDHFRCLYAFNEPWWRTLRRMDIWRRNIVDAGRDELNQAVDVFRSNLRNKSTI
jgi:hypothetical protein